MTTVSTPPSVNQSTSRCREATDAADSLWWRSALTAAMCIVAPTSMAAPFGYTRVSVILCKQVSVSYLLKGLGTSRHGHLNFWNKLLRDTRSPRILTGDDGLFRRLKKRSLNGREPELTDHLGYEIAPKTGGCDPFA